MSKQNNLTDFLTDVANAIRSKKGTTDKINPQNFSAEIAALSGGLEVIEMTETTATIEPNKVYVWGMVESLDITLGASTGEDDFFAFRFRCSKPTMTVVTVNGATWAADTELDESGNPILDLGSYYQCEIKGGTSALYARLAHYIPFEDSNVEAVLLAKGVGDGIGVTYKAAAKVTNLSNWFKNNTDIVKFNELYYFFSVTKANDLFFGCSNLIEATLPKSITFVSPSCFSGCSKLTSVKNFSENEYLVKIDANAFLNCSSITSAVVPKNVKAFGYSIFQGCTKLESVELPASLATAGIYVFKGCTKLRKIGNLENTAFVTLSSEFCSDCKAMTEITFPSALQNIGWGACLRDTALVKAVFGTEVTKIGDSTFSGCTSLKTIVLKTVTPPELVATTAIPSTIEAIYVPDESITAYQEAANWTAYSGKFKPLSEYTE